MCALSCAEVFTIPRARATSDTCGPGRSFDVSRVHVCVRSPANRESLGAVESCIGRLISLCSHPCADVTRNAAAALGNLSYRCDANKQHIGEQGGVSALLNLCHLALTREGVVVNVEGEAAERCAVAVASLDLTRVWCCGDSFRDCRRIAAVPAAAATAGHRCRRGRALCQSFARPCHSDGAVGARGRGCGRHRELHRGAVVGRRSQRRQRASSQRVWRHRGHDRPHHVYVLERVSVHVWACATAGVVCADCARVCAAKIASDNEIIHANASDVLANVTRYNCWITSQRILKV